MNKQVDERVVSMQFDNRHFEENVKNTMSSLDKLKEKLSFKDASKGFDELNGAAKKADLSPLAKSVEVIQNKFSALEVIGVTALANITNSAVNAGKNLVKSLSVDQITAGWSKYEQKTASIQTIMNSTGKSIDEVNGYLEKLMWFSDETSYGFTDMTSALATMTSSGGDIEKLIPLLTGVANATAFAGKGAAEFSRVLQFGVNQAYGLGYMQLQDWKTLQGANVNSKQLMQTLIDAGVELGKIKKGSVTTANFTSTLKDKWLDTEVMEVGFGRFGEFTDAVYQLSKDIESGNLSAYPEDIQKMAEDGKLETASQMIEALSGHYDELGVKAFKSAQEAKTFTEAIAATKDAVSSGWMKTFEIIFGNYEQQKRLWTDLANTLWDVFASGGESRNEWLSKVLSYNPITKFSEKLKQITDLTQNITDKMKDYEEVVNRIMRGDFGNGKSRWDKLTKEGYDWAHAQNLVNEKLGDSTRHATDYKEAVEGVTANVKEFTDEELRNLDFTEEEIKLYRELEAESKKTGKSIGELIESMEQMDARTLILNSFKNIGSGLLGVIYSLKEAFSEIFPPASAMQIYKIAEAFHNLTSKLRLTDAESGELNENGEKLKRTFKGIFAALDIVLTIVSGPIKLAFQVLTKILGAFDLNILDITAVIGDVIVGFRDWLDSVLDFSGAIEHVKNGVIFMIDKVKSWIAAFKELPVVQQTIEKFKNTFSNGFGDVWAVLGKVASGIKKVVKAFIELPIVQKAISKVSEVASNLFNGMLTWFNQIDLDAVIAKVSGFFNTITEWLTGLGNQDENGDNLISGLGNAISGGVKAVVDAITAICKAIYDTFTKFFDIHSPSKVFFTLGKFCIAGLVAGLLFAKSDTQSAMGQVGDALLSGLKTAVSTVVDIFKAIDFSKVFALGGAVAIFMTIHKLLDVMNAFSTAATTFSSAIKQFSAPFASAAKVLDAVAERINPKKKTFTEVADNILKLAAAIAILAGSVYLLAQLDAGKLWGAVGAIAALAAIIGILSVVVSKLGSAPDANYGKLALSLIGMSAALLIMSMAIKKLEFISKDNILPILGTVIALIGGMTLMLVMFGKFVKGKAAQNIDKAGVTLLKMSAVMWMLVTTIKMISKLEPMALLTGLSTLTLFGAFMVGLIAATKLAGKRLDACGSAILKLSAVMLLMVVTIKLISKMEPETIAKGITTISLFGGIITGLIAATKLVGGKDLTKLGGSLIGISGAILIMVITSKMLGKMNPGDIIKGAIGIALFGGVIAGLIAATNLAGGNNLKGLPATLLMASISIGMLAAVAIVLSLIDLTGLAKGIIAVSMLGGIVALMIWATRGAVDCQKNIIAMTTAIGVMAASVFVLSLIDTTKLATATLAMSMLMGMFAVIIKASGTVDSAIGKIVVMTVVVGLIAGMLYLLTSNTNCDDALKAALAISDVMLAMSAALKIISKIKMDKNVLGSIGGLALMCALLVGFAFALSKIPDVSDKNSSIITLAGTMAALTVLLAAISLVGKIGNIGQVFSGILGLTVMCGLLVGFAFALSIIPNVTDKTATIQTLIATMTALSVLLLVLTGIGAIFVLSGGIGALCGLAGIGGLIVMLGTMMLFAYALKEIPDLSNSIGTINMLTSLMTTMTGLLVMLAIVGPFAMIGVGALAGLTLLMVGMGELAVAVGALVTRFPKLEEFLDNGLPIFEKLAAGIGRIVGSVAAGFSESIIPVADNLSTFMTKLNPFIEGAESLDAELLNNINNLVSMISTLTGAGVKDAIASWFTGESSIVEFGAQLEAFAPHIVAFSNAVKDIDDDSVTSAANAGKMLAEMAESIPSDWGNNNLTKFGEQFIQYGRDIVSLSSELKKDEIDIDDITNAAKAGKELAEMAETIPTDWNHNNLTNFGNQLTEFGASLAGFSSAVKDNVSLDACKTAAKAGEELTEMTETIPTDWNHNNLSKFGEQLVSFANSLVTFNSTMDGQTATLKKTLSEIGQNGIKGLVESFAVPNKTIDEAIDEFLNSVVLTINGWANIDSSIYASFTSVGNYAIDGFVAGLNSATGLAKVTAAGTTIGNYALTAAKAAIDSNSPSKKFEELGLYSILGYTNGVKNNLKMVDDSGRSIGIGVLTALQDELEIHSPSVVMNKQGHYIVQGVAEGIKKDMSAEEAAEKKAQNIVDAFQKVFDKIDIDSEIAKNQFELWKSTDGKNLSSIEQHYEYEKFLSGQLERDKKTRDTAYDKWQQMLANGFKADSQEAKEAFNEFVKASNAVTASETAVKDAKVQEWDNWADKAQKAIDRANSEYETWLATEGKYVDKETRYKKLKELLEYEKVNLQDIENRAKWKLEWLKSNGATEDEIAEAQVSYNEAIQNRVDKEDEIQEAEHTRKYSDKYDEFDKAEAQADRNKQIWLAKNPYASTAEELAFDKTQAQEAYNRATEEWHLAVDEYNEILAKGSTGLDVAEELEAARVQMEEKWIAQMNAGNKVSAITKSILENARDIAKDKAELASEIAEHEYNVWEKTEGRKATDTEKDIKRLELYNRQLASQTRSYNLALEAMREARSTYGSDSQEYRDAYREVLREESSILDLQDKILTTKEDLEKRQKKQYNKQQLAMSEYKDYIKKYKQYYLEHGLTMEDLERDAKAAANYDPTKTVQNVVSKTSSALGTALNSSGAYSLGSSYVESVSTGMTENMYSVTEATQTMLTECSETLSESQPKWEELGYTCAIAFGNGITKASFWVSVFGLKCANECMNTMKQASRWEATGKQCVIGFANGLKSNAWIAAEAARYVARQAIAAAESTFDVNSPSKVFWNTARFCVEGLAGGFIDNSNLSEAAARSMAEDAVDSFTMAIQQITDSVDSELDAQPTIRPVLDLSNVERGAARLTNMFSRDQAVGISAMRNTSNKPENQNGNTSGGSEGKTINYVQNNYSPKALSPTDIYRRTKNQLSAMKGVL